jgi:hypothetical protein
MNPKCESHEELVTRVARIEANTDQILITLSRLEARMYEDHGASSGTAGAVSATAKTVGIAIAASAALMTLFKLVIG